MPIPGGYILQPRGVDKRFLDAGINDFSSTFHGIQGSIFVYGPRGTGTKTVTETVTFAGSRSASVSYPIAGGISVEMSTGNNHEELAIMWNLSVRQVRRIVNEQE